MPLNIDVWGILPLHPLPPHEPHIPYKRNLETFKEVGLTAPPSSSFSWECLIQGRLAFYKIR